MESRATAKDFFLHLGAIVGLYTVAISFVNLLFTVINKIYPAVNVYYNYYGPSYNISMPVATLIIVFPIFILLSWLLEKSYVVDPSKKQLGVRKWLTYITLFVAGLILVGDLVTVLYKFLDGQDLTGAFLLKALVVLLVAGFVFTYYIQDIREKLMGKKIWGIVSGLIILFAIIVGFSIIGSPQSQRLSKLDSQKVTDLQNIQWQIISYWQKTGALPSAAAALNDSLSGFSYPLDPQTGEMYEYKMTGQYSFQLCANFNRPSSAQQSSAYPILTNPKGSLSMDYWTHETGRVCFDRNIDPTLYPVYKQ